VSLAKKPSAMHVPDMKRDSKTVYFFAKVAVAKEPITEATRFFYFLVFATGNATRDESAEMELKAKKKIQKIVSLLSQRDKRTYTVVQVDTLSHTAYTVLKKYFPMWDTEVPVDMLQ
jgi:hypothetical protein